MVMLACVAGGFFFVWAKEQRSRGRNREEAIRNMSFAASPLVRALPPPQVTQASGHAYQSNFVLSICRCM